VRLLFNETVVDDLVNLLAFIDQFAEGAGLGKIEVEPRLIESVLRGMRQDFPCQQGIDEASVFKKVANFALYFVSIQPIVRPFPAKVIGEDLANIRNHQNGIVALIIALKALEGAVIHQKAQTITIQHPIELSHHSYVDIVNAISLATPLTGYLLLTVLFEQLTYKTNPDCQYEPFSF